MAELTQVSQLVGAFLGGGIAKSVLDYLLTNRTAKRAELRPFDRERINSVRDRCRAIFEKQVRIGFAEESDEDVLWGYNYDFDVERLVHELNDRRLMTFWRDFSLTAEAFPERYRRDTSDEDTEFSKLHRAHMRLRDRLNDLERKR